MQTTIPFSGFYESIHSSMIDDAVEGLVRDDCGEIVEGCEDIFWEVNYPEVFDKYAKMYLENFNIVLNYETKLNIKLHYDELSSPREYNFTTDRIFAKISQRNVKLLYKLVDKKILEDLIAKRFTSCSGFISYYDNKLADWGKIETWDHNQVGTLLEAVAIMFKIDEGDLVVDSYEQVDDFVYSALTPAGQDLVKLADAKRYADENQLTLPLKKGGE